MSFQSNGTDIGHQPAAADLSAAQFKFVKFGANGVDVCGVADKPDGILQNKPGAAGRAAVVRIGGVSKLRASAAIARGAKVAPAADGSGVTSADLSLIGARALEAASAANALIAVELKVGSYVDRQSKGVAGAAP